MDILVVVLWLGAPCRGVTPRPGAALRRGWLLCPGVASPSWGGSPSSGGFPFCGGSPSCGGSTSFGGSSNTQQLL